MAATSTISKVAPGSKVRRTAWITSSRSGYRSGTVKHSSGGFRISTPFARASLPISAERKVRFAPGGAAKPAISVEGRAASRESASARSLPSILPPLTGWHAAKIVISNKLVSMSPGFLFGEIIDLLIHFVSRLNNFRIRLIRPLAGDEIDKFIHDADVRLFDITLD